MASLQRRFIDYWQTGTPVKVFLTDRCTMEFVVGKVTHVATSGAFAVVDGWELPLDDVLAVNEASSSDERDYRAAVVDLARRGIM